MMKRIFFGSLGLSIATAFSGGYEKNIILSGKQAGLAGASASNVAASQSLMFNPAGLAAAEHSDGTLHFSPTLSKFKAPLHTADAEVESKQKFSPVYGVTVAYKLQPNWGVGLGYYVAGGSSADYGEQDLSTKGFSAVKPKYSSHVTISELAAGVGFEAVEGLRLGAAWRMNLVDASYNTGNVSATSALAVRYSDLKDTTYNGVRVGAQWAPPEGFFGLGVSWRSGIKFKAEGNVSGDLETLAAPGTKTTLVGSKASFENYFPQQVALGGHVDLAEDLRLYGEYVWSEYSRNQRIKATGTLDTATGAAVLRSNGIEQNWKNQHNYRVAAEYTGWSWALRGGYVYTSQVTDSQRPKPTFSVPGSAHTFALGTGSQLWDDQLELNLAFEHSFASGKTTKAQTLNGDYSNKAYSLHTSLSYLF